MEVNGHVYFSERVNDTPFPRVPLQSLSTHDMPSLRCGDWEHGFVSKEEKSNTSMLFGNSDSHETEEAAKFSLFLTACSSEACSFQ